VEGWLALGEWASARGLGTQAREAYHRALSASPGDPRANAALGNVQMGGRWVSEDESYRARGYVQFEGQWITSAEHEAILRARAAETEAERARGESEARVREAEAPIATRSEKAWFLFYGLASSAYRVLVTILIALFIAGRFFLVGVLLAAWALVAMAVVPLWRALRHVLASPRLRKQRRRAVVVTVGSAASVLVLALALPLPYHSDAEGVVWLSEQAMVRAGANGFVESLLVRPGSRVAAGDPVLRTRDPVLAAQLRLSEAKVEELEAAYGAEFVVDRARAQIVREKLEGARAVLARAEERAGEAIVRARADGMFVVPQAADLPGRYFRKGALVGYVVGEQETPLVRVVVPQDAVDPVRVATDRILVRLVSRPDVVAEGRVVRQVPGGEAYLPSRALATDGGGSIATDPRDTTGPKALERMFQFDVALTGAPHLGLFGERAYVRFEHRLEPLALRWYRDVRRLFLSRFGV